MKIDVMVASVGHLKYVKVINDTIDEAAKARGTGVLHEEPTNTSPIKSIREKRLLL